ncbi:MAG: ABC transporter permease [Bryobacteraceae bacterium]
MGWLRFFRRKKWDEDRARELASYLELETADNIARGMTHEQARRAAQTKLGNSTLIREEIYHMNTLGTIETLWQDIRYGARALRKSPGFTLVALLSLALGIGATTAIFSVVYGVLVSPYPYAKPNEIWTPMIRDLKDANRGRMFYQMREYAELKKVPAFADVMATNPSLRLLSGDRAPESFVAVQVTANAFRFLGVTPALGRTIEPTDVKADGQPESVIVLSFEAWHRLFNGDRAALGKTLRLDDQPFTVIGVMPPRFGWFTHDGGWIILPEDTRTDQSSAVIVRLQNGVSKQVGEDQLRATHQRLAKEFPDAYPKGGFTSGLKNYMEMTVASGEMQSSLRLLFGAVGFLLLIACANVANLQLARGTTRAHEIAVRMSIGAGRFRLFRQLLTESIVLSIAGGALGVLLAVAITRGIVALMPEFYVPNEARIEINAWVLLFSAVASVLTGIIFGLVPALKSTRPDLVDELKAGGRTLAGGGAGGRIRNGLVVTEIALAVVMLMGASLTIRGFLDLQNRDTGIQADRVLTVGLQSPPKKYATYEQRVAFSERVLEAVSTIPGVQSATMGNGAMPFGGPRSKYAIEGQPSDESRFLQLGLVSSSYQQTMGIPLRAGRGLTAQEVTRAEPVALINEAASKLWPPGTSAIGARVRLDVIEKPGGPVLKPASSTPTVTVVGIIGDTRNAGLKKAPVPAAFIPYTLLAPPFRTLAIRTLGQPMLVLNAVRERIQSVDKDQPLSNPMTMDEVLGFETVQPRFNMALFTFFGFLGLALSAVGIYSMLSYTVAQRTHEIGIRMALGAAKNDVLSLMLGMGGRLVLIGLAVGLTGSLILAKYLRSEVFQISATDPLAVAGVIVLLSAVALLACFVPARRAAKLDPMSALRRE